MPSTKNIQNIKIGCLSAFAQQVLQLIRIVRPNRAIIYQRLINEWFVRFRHTCLHSGLRLAILEAKEFRLLFTRYLAKEPLGVSKLRIGIYHNGLPKALKTLRDIDPSDPWDVRFTLTLLSFSRLFTLPPVGDFAPINNPPISDACSVSDRELSKAVRQIVKRPSLISTEFKMYHLSNRNGPMGIPAMLGSLYEAAIIIENSFLTESIRILAGENLWKRLNLVSISPHKLHKKQLFPKQKFKELLRRLVVIQDKEGKSRIIAILDYWSQCALKPLHDSVMEILRSLRSDMTYDQAYIPLDIIDDQIISSFDLVSATDRFPLSFQKRVLNMLIGPKKSDAWSAILTSLPFYCDGVNHTFRTGQPLGAYSSWAVFTLCHHIIVRIAMNRVGVPYTDKVYRILGDDIVIFNNLVSEQYVTLMHELGVEISKSKTHRSKVFFELAKRQFIKQNNVWLEVTGFPVAGLPQVSKLPYLLHHYIKGVVNKGWGELEQLLMTSDSSILLSKTFGGRPNRSFYKDFVLSGLSIKRIEDGVKLWNMFPRLNPYCNNDKRFLSLIWDAYALSRIRILSKNIGRLLSYSISPTIKVLKSDVNEEYRKVIFGVTLSSFAQGSLYSNSFPYISVWNELVNQYDEVIAVIREGLVNEDNLYKLVDQKVIQAIHRLPKIEELDMTPRNQTHLELELRVIKDVIANVLDRPDSLTKVVDQLTVTVNQSKYEGDESILWTDVY
jgi:hypothetical protein